jgi:hypothetical protein
MQNKLQFHDFCISKAPPGKAQVVKLHPHVMSALSLLHYLNFVAGYQETLFHTDMKERSLFTAAA